MNKTFWQIWGWPVFLFMLTIFGLLAALLGRGIWHWLSWIALATPLTVITWHTMIKR